MPYQLLADGQVSTVPTVTVSPSGTVAVTSQTTATAGGIINFGLYALAEAT